MSEIVTGLLAKAYIDPSGVGGSTWTEVKILGDVQLPSSHNTGKVKERGSGFEKTVLGQKVNQATFTLTRRVGNANWEAIRDAYLNKTLLGFAFMTGPIATSGSEGWQFDGVIVDFPIAEPLEEASTVDVVVEPAAESTVEPSYVEIA